MSSTLSYWSVSHSHPILTEFTIADRVICPTRMVFSSVVRVCSSSGSSSSHLVRNQSRIASYPFTIPPHTTLIESTRALKMICPTRMVFSSVVRGCSSSGSSSSHLVRNQSRIALYPFTIPPHTTLIESTRALKMICPTRMVFSSVVRGCSSSGSSSSHLVRNQSRTALYPFT